MRQRMTRPRGEAPPILVRDETKCSTYTTNPYLLYFTDPATEQRYFEFQYVDNSFIPGKTFGLLWGGVTLIALVTFTQPFSNDASYTVHAFSSTWWVGSYISSVINFILTVGLFVDSLKRHREIILLAQMVVGWPTLVLCIMYTKRPHAYTYSTLSGCFLFAMLIAQCRLHRSLFFVTVVPLVCMFAVTFGISEFWDHHSKIEMLYWLYFMIPLALLHFLEGQTRKSFAEREQAVQGIADIERRTAVNQRVIVNFFPSTPTRDLLQQVGGPCDKAYPDIVLIVTDIAGFTAHTSLSDPSDVISMLTNMFKAFDSTAGRFNVEKIATVGDSYCGAVFPSDTKTTAERCEGIILFACAALGFAGPKLELRIGVHLGDVTGIFVGRAPPKFDLFGPGIDHARLMEESGQPSHVHISHTILSCVGVRSYLPNQLATEHGMLCTYWNEERTHRSITALHISVCDSDALNADNIVETLCIIAQIEPPNHDPHDLAPDHLDENVDKFEFNKLFLTFNSASVEAAFQKRIVSSGIHSFCAKLFLMMSFTLFVIQLNLQCDSTQDMGVASAILAVLGGMAVYIMVIGTHHRYHTPITYGVYNGVAILASLALKADCNGFEMQASYVGNIASSYNSIAVFAPQYCFDAKLMYRFLFVVSNSALWSLWMVVRYFVYADGVAVIDPTTIDILAFVTMSFFPDYSLRSAFRTEMQLQQLKRAARSRGAAMATSALSIMLPTFVTEKIVQLATRTEGKQGGAISDTATSSTNSSNEAADIDFNGVSMIWEYNHAVLMFAKFHSDDSAFTPEVINETVQAIEQIMKQHNVMKVKTIGSTVMAVCGIDDRRTRQDQLAAVVDAAIMIRACVFQQVNVPNLMHRIGIHCGPCFGAVIGGNGAIFDLFGDTVNTASRMMSNAAYGGIQISAAANGMLLPRLHNAVESRPPIVMKGKGLMQVFAVKEGIGDARTS